LNFTDRVDNQSFFDTLNPSIEETKKLVFYQLALSNPTYPVTINLKVKFRVFATDTGTVAGFVT